MNTVWTKKMEDDLRHYFAKGNTCYTHFANRHGIDYKTVSRKAHKMGLIARVRKASTRNATPEKRVYSPTLSAEEIAQQQAGKLVQDCYLAWENRQMRISEVDHEVA